MLRHPFSDVHCHEISRCDGYLCMRGRLSRRASSWIARFACRGATIAPSCATGTPPWCSTPLDVRSEYDGVGEVAPPLSSPFFCALFRAFPWREHCAQAGQTSFMPTSNRFCETGVVYPHCCGILITLALTAHSSPSTKRTLKTCRSVS